MLVTVLSLKVFKLTNYRLDLKNNWVRVTSGVASVVVAGALTLVFRKS